MKAKDLMEGIFSWCNDNGVQDYSNTCDTVKTGNPEKDIRKVAVAMTATVAVLRDAVRWGADLLIVHEPTFYDHFDRIKEDDPVVSAKLQLIRDGELIIWRYHDHPHNKHLDMIHEGFAEKFDLKGTWKYSGSFGKSRFILDTEITPETLAERFFKGGAKHLRVCGNLKEPGKKISFCLGAPGEIFEELCDPEVEIVISGEACEWMEGEYARDAAELGMKKTLMILGHIPSEKEGMVLLAEMISKQYPDLDIKYFDCGEICSSVNFTE